MEGYLIPTHFLPRAKHLFQVPAQWWDEVQDASYGPMANFGEGLICCFQAGLTVINSLGKLAQLCLSIHWGFQIHRMGEYVSVHFGVRYEFFFRQLFFYILQLLILNHRYFCSPFIIEHNGLYVEILVLVWSPLILASLTCFLPRFKEDYSVQVDISNEYVT